MEFRFFSLHLQPKCISWKEIHFLFPTQYPKVSSLNPNRPLDCYAQTYFLFVIYLSVYQLQWNPIAPSKRKDICSKI